MIIQLSPQVNPSKLTVSKQGDSLTINGELFDFSPLTAGSMLPAVAVGSDFIIGNVYRKDGQLNITLLLPILFDAPAPATFPTPIINPPDGEIDLPEGTNK